MYIKFESLWDIQVDVWQSVLCISPEVSAEFWSFDSNTNLGNRNVWVVK